MSSTQTKGNILIIDDLPDNLHLLSDLLTQLGYTVRSVTTGRMALKTLNIKQPDLILLDIKMPDMDGYQVCQMIKADEHLRDIPIIFISALDDTFDKVKAFRIGGVDYITKPFQIEEVVVRLENQLTIQRQQKKLQQEIAKRQETEEILYQSRALLASILNASLDGIAALQAVRTPKTGEIEDFRCLVVNPIISRAFNRSREDLIGKIVLKKFLQRFEPELFTQFVEVVETGKFLEKDIYWPWEKSSWYHLIAVKLGDGFAITVRDITSRKQLELALQAANQKLEMLANVDGLTGVANRRCFDNCLVREWQSHYREKLPLSLILIDIDCFKNYNDYYGHQSGDDCLIQVAQTLKKATQRARDLIARYGGEEFVAILPNTNQEEAMMVARAIKNAISALKIPHAQSNISSLVTISLGITTIVPDCEENLEMLIQQADQALYQAKSQGRNQWVVFSQC